MSHPVLEKYKSLKTINDETSVNKLLAILVEVPRERLSEFFAGSAKGGRFYIFRHESVPGKLIEYVPDMSNDTSVTTLFDEHPVFESRQKLLEAREEIIAAIDHLLMAIPGTTTVGDEGRGKEFRLAEFGTAQLLEILQHFANN